MSLLPLRAETRPRPAEPRVLDIEGEEADAAFEALSSETARRVLGCLYEDPRTPTEVQDVVGTSLQNVHYHLGRLEDAGLIEPAGVGYSEKGNEMTVYAPTSEAVVLFAGPESDRSRLRALLARVLSLAAVLAVATLGFAFVYRTFFRPEASSAFDADATALGGDAASGAEAGAARTAAETLGSLDPVLAFFLGGAVVVLVLSAWWTYRTYGPGTRS